MVPDLPLFLRGGPSYSTLHSPLTAVPAGIPLGLACLLAFEWSKGPLVALLPAPLQSKVAARARAEWPRDLAGWSAVIAGLALGILTHVVWDAFTHDHRWGVRLVPLLARTALHVGSLPLPGYRLMQYVSSVVGLAIVARASWRWLDSLPPSTAAPEFSVPGAVRAAVAAVLLVVAPAVCLIHALALARRAIDDPLGVAAYEFITRTGALEALLILGFAAASRLAPKSRAAGA
jgi:hypothetical protein